MRRQMVWTVLVLVTGVIAGSVVSLIIGTVTGSLWLAAVGSVLTGTVAGYNLRPPWDTR